VQLLPGQEALAGALIARFEDVVSPFSKDGECQRMYRLKVAT
jgi:hypothetical protein